MPLSLVKAFYMNQKVIFNYFKSYFFTFKIFKIIFIFALSEKSLQREN